MPLSIVRNGAFFTESFVYNLDQPLFRFLTELEQNAPGWVNGPAQLYTDILSQGLTVATVVILAYFLFRRHFHRFWLLFTAVAGGELLWLALIFIANRPRPTEIRAITGLVDWIWFKRKLK